MPVLERALAGNPLSVDTLFEPGKVEMYSGQPEQFIVRGEKIPEIDPASVHGYLINIADVELFTLVGQVQVALDRLQQAVDGGWKSHWRSAN